MYDDSPTFLPNAEGAVVPKFPTSSITTPVAIFYGKKDTLPDVEYILGNISHPIMCMEVEGRSFPFHNFAVETN